MQSTYESLKSERTQKEEQQFSLALNKSIFSITIFVFILSNTRLDALLPRTATLSHWTPICIEFSVWTSNTNSFFSVLFSAHFVAAESNWALIKWIEVRRALSNEQRITHTRPSYSWILNLLKHAFRFQSVQMCCCVMWRYVGPLKKNKQGEAASGNENGTMSAKCSIRRLTSNKLVSIILLSNYRC